MAGLPLAGTKPASNVARGKDDRRQSFTKAEAVEGGTIGPVKKGR